MKKKFLAGCLAVATGGIAQAQTSIVLYGIGDADVRLDHTSIGTLRSVGSGGENGSRWGIRGTEDLGDGLKAVFAFEQGFDLSDNSVPQGAVGGVTPNSPLSSTATGNRIFSRTAQVGLSSAQAGDLLFGRAYTPFYNTWSSIDPMSAGLVGGAQNFALENGGLNAPSRFDNGIYYNSPKFYGFQVTGAYRLGESATDSVASGSTKSGGNAGNLSVTYSAGPLLVGASYLNVKNSLNNNTDRTEFVGAAYDLGFVKLDAMYFRDRNQTTGRRQSYAAGLTVPVRAFNFFGQVARIDNQYAANNSALKFDDALFIGLGANYALSKRTDLYASWGKQINRGNAIYVVSDAGNAGLFVTTGTTANVNPGFDPWSAQVGIRHKF